MSETKQARDKIKEFIENSERSLGDYASMFNCSKQYLSKVLNGETTGKKANELIVSIISAFKIR